MECQRTDGSIGGDLVRVLDHDEPENNEFLAVNQFTVVEDRHERRPDVELFVDGLTDDEVDFCNALETDDSAVKALGDETVKTIARELVATLKKERHHRLDHAG